MFDVRSQWARGDRVGRGRAARVSRPLRGQELRRPSRRRRARAHPQRHRANREQIEKVFFRALTSLIPSNATFALTRAATIQAARDLYGAGGAVERAVTQAWDAVGVQARVAPTAAMLPNPAAATSATCGGVAPSCQLFLTVSVGDSNLRIT